MKISERDITNGTNHLSFFDSYVCWACGSEIRTAVLFLFKEEEETTCFFFFSIEARWSCAAVMSCGAFATSTRGVKGGEKKDVAAPAAAATTAAPCVRECQLVVRVDARADVSVLTCAPFVSPYFFSSIVLFGFIFLKKKFNRVLNNNLWCE